MEGPRGETSHLSRVFLEFRLEPALKDGDRPAVTSSSKQNRVPLTDLAPPILVRLASMLQASWAGIGLNHSWFRAKEATHACLGLHGKKSFLPFPWRTPADAQCGMRLLLRQRGSPGLRAWVWALGGSLTMEGKSGSRTEPGGHQATGDSV